MKPPLSFARRSVCFLASLPLALLPAAEPATGITGMLHPSLSPDGERIAVSWQGSIALMPAQGGALRCLTHEEGWDLEPQWSPDGKTVVFIRSGGFSGGRVMRLDVESGETLPLPQSPGGQGKLSFSPDGKRLLGRFNTGAGVPLVAWLDLASGEFEALPIGPEDPARYQRKGIRHALSADGESVFYTLHRDEPGEQTGNRGPQCEVWRYREDGGEPELLFTWPARFYDLACDPDGKSLVVVTDLGSAHNELWRLPLEAPLAGAVRLTTDLADDDRPTLGGDGRSLVWTNNAGGGTALRHLDTGSGEKREIRATSVDYGEPAGRLSLEFREGGDGGAGGGPVTVRVSIKRDDGKFVFPPRGALYRLLNSAGHFYAEGTAAFDVPSGTYRVRAFRGLEYRVAERTFTVEAGGETTAVMAMKRWTDQSAEGWYSGENHVHANYGYGEWYNTPTTVLRQAEGEDLNVCNAVVANSDGEAVFDREFFLGQIDPRSKDEHLVYFGQEFRSTIWGHMTFTDLAALVEPIMTGFHGTTNPQDTPTNADLALRVVEQGGTVAYTHPSANLLDLYNQPYSAKGLPVDAALGRVSLMDVHGATYARGSVNLWYRLMNCGLDIVGSTGTDVFLNRVRSFPPGWARTYVHLPEGLGYRAWIRGQTEGRSFFTSGPMLRFSVEGRAMGETLELERPGPVRVEAHAVSATPLERVELVRNGDAVLELELAPDRLSASFEGETGMEASGWIALRAVAEAHPDAVRGQPAAHSNPVRIKIPGHPNPKTAREAAYFLKWIDRLGADLAARGRFPSGRLREHAFHQLEVARDYYRPLATPPAAE